MPTNFDDVRRSNIDIAFKEGILNQLESIIPLLESIALSLEKLSGQKPQDIPLTVMDCSCGDDILKMCSACTDERTSWVYAERRKVGHS